MKRSVENAPTFRPSGQYANLKPRRVDYLQRIAETGLDGFGWYDTARRELETVAALERWNAARFTAIVALTSPRCSVRRNIRNALTYAHTGEFLQNTLGNVKRSVHVFEQTGELRGQKVAAFSEALQGDENAIVLDVHVARAMGVPQASFSVPVVVWRCRKQIFKLAERLGTTPANAQAALWFGWKRKTGGTGSGGAPTAFPVLEEYANFLAHNREFPRVGVVETR